jgi:hypothetical protein
MDAYASDTGMAPSINTPGIGDYLTAHTVLIAHANIYRMYERDFKQQQQGTPAAKAQLRQKTNTVFNNNIYICKLQTPPNRRVELLSAENPGTCRTEICVGATDGHNVLEKRKMCSPTTRIFLPGPTSQ